MSMPLRLKIVTYNILADAFVVGHEDRYPLANPEHLPADYRYPRIANRLAESDADIICLQEVDPEAYLTIIARLRKLGYSGFWATRPSDKPDGLAVLVRGTDRLFSRKLGLPDPPHLKKPTNRIALLVYATFGDAPIHVVNAHLQWDDPRTPLLRRAGLLQANDLVSQLSERPYRPTIICGDFNATPDDLILRDMRALGLVDCHPDGTPATCNANHRAQKVDYVLTTPDWRTIRVDESPTVVDDTPLPSATEPSDHIQLAVEMELVT